ncbi:helix-turn-helix domain-containing protein [Antarctobacter heliothermus]|uniref:Helix-turn-helix domain-containing protein n=1 Tax=Antarctobacter heliothermus TaxID=74033 RepID=A0A239JT14_9RHOB|nr:helix-turn-helix domain-containing protein [Antarctobacter heliothermus]SNT08568.1 Helix-turn-helix domain-containing protein [Antarctobacter heliothermus]
MSHDATNWAIKQRGLKPAAKIVLWHLCDRFNPDYGCFPSQVRLAHDCEISRATLNRHLDGLEARGLIRRIRVTDSKTGQQRPTRYLLGCEPGFTPRGPGQIEGDSTNPFEAGEAEIPCPDLRHGSIDEKAHICSDLSSGTDPKPCLSSGHGPVSQLDANPCLKNDQSRVSNCDTNLVREPLSKPVKEEEDAAARDSDFDRFFSELLSALGFAANATLPAWWQGWPARAHVRRWIDDFGLSERRIIEVATETRSDHPNPPDGPKALDRAMERAAQRDAQAAATNVSTLKSKRSRKAQGTPSPGPDELAEFYAAKVNSEEYLPPSMISNAMCEAMLARRLVTADRLRLRGVR